jgi:SAM-dependent methyltransferase
VAGSRSTVDPRDAAADPSSRFTQRAGDYVRGRPGYPEPLFDALVAAARLPPGAWVADVGAGTGLSAEPLLERGLRVAAVEPNAAMRAAALARLGGRDGFRAVAGSAEATGLDAASVDLVLAAQAFHWFDPARARAEFLRILRPAATGSDPTVALVWNARRATGTPFLAAYEELLLRFGTDYREVGHRGVNAERLAGFFGAAPAHRRFENRQDLDLDGLRARLLSSSYVPAAGRPGHREMLEELARIFRAHAAAGRVRLEYDADLYLGRPAPDPA